MLMLAMAALKLPYQTKACLPTETSSPRIPPTIVLLKMCKNFQEVRQLHAQLIVSGLITRRNNASKLIESYVSISEIYWALSVFEATASPDTFAYNTMMRGLTLGKGPFDSLLLYTKLLLRGLAPDTYSYTFFLKACSYLRAVSQGKQVHCQIIKAGEGAHTHITSSLIHMYATSGNIDSAERVLAQSSEQNTLAKNSMITGYLIEGRVENARRVFDSMSDKDVASWSAMVSGYTKNLMYEDALTLFQEMVQSRVPPNESALVSAISACANLGVQDSGVRIHEYIDKTGVKISNTLGTALIDMYAKCGSIESAYKVFDEMSSRDIVTWGAMISGFAIHGRAQKCFQLLEEMVAGDAFPNRVVFTSILSACSHAGHVEMGHHYFNRMVGEFGIRPSIEHYGCMVDLLGRAGQLSEAEELINSMTEKPNAVIWGSLLSACKKYNDPERGNRAFRKLVELEPTSGDWYKQGGVMFERAGKREDAMQVRRFIKETEMETTRGSSFIEVGGVVHEFAAGDTDHNMAREIYKMTEEINRSMAIVEDRTSCI